MNTTAPWSIKGIGVETREAAKDAARRSGLSLGDWLDGIISERASILGVSKSEVEADERLEAVAAKLARFVDRGALGSDHGQNPRWDRPHASLGPQVGHENAESNLPSAFDPITKDFRATQTAIANFRDRAAQGLAAPPDDSPEKPAVYSRATSKPRRFDERSVREAVAEIARRQADLDGPQPPNRADAEPAPVTGPLRQSAAEAPLPVGAALVPPAEAPVLRAPWLDDVGAMSRSFEQLAGELRQAIREIDTRPSVENIDREMRAINQKFETLQVAATDDSAIHRIGEQTREMRDLLTAAANRTPIMGDVERRIASLDHRIASLAEAPREPGFGSDRLLGEIRAMLERFRPGPEVETLERRIEELSSKIDQGLSSDLPAALIGKLAHRVEDLHDSLRGGIRAPSVDTKPLETLVRGIAERIEDARAASNDFSKLEMMIQDLAKKFDAGRAPPDFKAVQALENQITRIADRLDRSESSLKTLDSVERSLGELFQQFEETRRTTLDAVETVARSAARDTMREVMHNLPASPPREAPSNVIEKLAQSIADLHSVQDSSQRRTQVTLTGLSLMIERLIDHLASQAAPASPTNPASPAKPESLPGPDDGPLSLAEPEEFTVPRGAARSLGAEPAGSRQAAPPRPRAPEPAGPPPAPREEAAVPDRTRTRRAEAASSSAVDPTDILIEPGSGRTPKRGSTPAEAPRAGRPAPVVPGVEPPSPAEAEGPAAFIAAARRAAQAAQVSAAAAVAPKPSPKAAATSARGGDAAMSTLERARAFLTQRRRPILLSLAGLVLLIGALEIFKVSVERPPAEASPGKAEVAVPVPADTAASQAMSPARPLPNRQATIAPAPASSTDLMAPSLAAPPPMVPPATLPNTAAVQAPPPPPPILAGQTPQAGDVPVVGISEGLHNLAASGDRAAQFEIALRYSDGRGVSRDPKVAVSWFQKAAAQGLVPAEYRLGSAYEKGVGVARDPALAMAWYDRAAQAGNIRAMHNLAVMAAEGAVGKPDYARAASWFQKAAALGVRDSQFNLAILYARGLGIEQNLAQSYMWFAVAAAQGDDDAAKKRDEVAVRLDAKALAAAKAEADNFHPAIGDRSANDVPAPAGGWDAVAPAPQHQTPPSGAKPGAPRVSAL